MPRPDTETIRRICHFDIDEMNVLDLVDFGGPINADRLVFYMGDYEGTYYYRFESDKHFVCPAHGKACEIIAPKMEDCTEKCAVSVESHGIRMTKEGMICAVKEGSRTEGLVRRAVVEKVNLFRRNEE